MELTWYKVNQTTRNLDKLWTETCTLAFFISKKQAKSYVKSLEEAYIVKTKPLSLSRSWCIEETFCDACHSSSDGDA